MRLALEWYERAADFGCVRTHWELAKMYLEGFYVESDPGRYIEQLGKATELGNPDAELRLSQELSGGVVGRDLSAAFAWLSRSAAQNNSMAKFAVGYVYTNGLGVERSKTEVEIWFFSAAITGDREIFLEVGIAYEFCLFKFKKDLMEVARWYKYSVDMGHKKCILCWRSVFETLDSAKPETMVSHDSRLESTGFQTEMDDIDSVIDLADPLFELGDEEGALEYYQLAADLGSSKVIFTIATIYHQGIAVKRDDAYAIRLLVMAVDSGFADAQFYLTSVYEIGTISLDDAQIVKLYADTAHNGFLATFYYLGRYVDRPEVYVRRTHTRV